MAANKNLAENPYERLANAILLQAVADYRAALKKVKHNPGSKDAIHEALQLEKFFRSQWYEMLTKVDGKYLIRRLQEEIRQSESIRGNKNKSSRR